MKINKKLAELFLPIIPLSFVGCSTCTETWFSPSMKYEKSQHCQNHAIEMRGDDYGIIDEKPYMIVKGIFEVPDSSWYDGLTGPTPGPGKQKLEEQHRYFAIPEPIDLAHFRQIHTKDGYRYATDGQLLFDTNKLTGNDIDPDTFESVQPPTITNIKLSVHWAKDKNHVYYNGKVFLDAKFEDLNFIDDEYFKYKDKIYYMDVYEIQEKVH
jgi:hypothetical protein